MENKFSIIPEVFYDFISRVPVGAIFLVSLWILFPCHQLLEIVCECKSSALGVLLPILLLILSYVTGYFLASCGGSIFNWFKCCRPDGECFVELIESQRHPPYFNKCDFDTNFPHRLRIKMFVFLMHRDPQIALEMAKHEAEAALFKGLSFAFLLLFLVWLVGNCCCDQFFCLRKYEHGCHPGIGLVLLVLLVLCILVAVNRVKNNWQYYFEFCRALFKIRSSQADKN